ncbi:MAG: amylo-alpha-1,6-glucosidase [Flavisolibacter sp.]
MMSDDELRERVRSLMFDNIKAGLSPYLKKHYCYVMPSPGNYPFQWWWDTCFNVFILCALNETALAKQNLLSLFRMQKKNGFVGHMIFWESLLPRDKLNILQGPPVWHQVRPHMSSLIQPPLVAQAVLRIYKHAQDKEFLMEMLPRIKRYYHWLRVNRDFDGDGLISIISAFESGIDWKPSFDEPLGNKSKKVSQKYFWQNIYVDFRNFLRGYNLKRIYKANVFIVKETLFNTMYVQDLRALSELCKMLNDEDAETYEALAHKVAKRMIEIMYDEDTAAFYDVHGPQNKKLKVLTFTIAVPILIKEVSKEIAHKILKTHFLNENEFNLTYPIPSVAKCEPSFHPYESKFLWRGPTWTVVNWFLYHSFKTNGFEKEAKALLKSIKTLIEKSGFREYYNPNTGKGYGAKDFTWSGLVVDMMDDNNDSL